MSSKTKCPWCQDRSSADGLLCQGASSCTERLERALGDVRAMEDAAVVTYRRAARLGTGGGPAEESPLPFDPRVRPAMINLTRCVDAVVSMVQTRTPDGVPVNGTLGRRAMWLTTHIGFLRRQVGTADLAWFEDLVTAVRHVERIVDRPPERAYMGQCNRIVGTEQQTCDTDLYVDVTYDEDERPAFSPFVLCPSCGETWPTRERRDVMLRAAQDQLLIPADLSRALTRMQDPVTPERIRKWVERRQLVPRGTDRNGRAQYRLGDVRDLLRQHEARLERRRTTTR